jgi:4-amino-4-deoxy-L-arabinose transferase-like glycosyltransferase
MVVWALVVIGFFALSRSKLEYYALPAFPALAVRLGGAWAGGRDIGRWLAAGLVGCAAVGAWLVWLGGRLTPTLTLDGLAALNVYYRILREHGEGLPFDSVAPFGVLLQTLGLTLLVGWAAAAACWWRGRRPAALAALLGIGVVITALVVQVLHLVEPHHSARAVAQAIRAGAAPADVIAHEGSLEYSAALPFYTGRRILVVNGARGDLDFASRRPEGRGWFLDTTGFAEAWTRPGRMFLVSQRPRERSVVASLPAGSLHVLGKFGSRWLYSNQRDS